MVGSPETQFIEVCGHRLEVQRIEGARAPTLVLLHEGLGSISLWRDFPQRIAAATGCPVALYSRYGHGRSDVLGEPRPADYLQREALDVLPELLEKLAIREPLLVGHSDGATIALIYAASGKRVLGLVAMAPHVFVEDVTLHGLAKAKVAFETTDFKAKLGRHHTDVAKTFYAWNDLWQQPGYRDWNIEAQLPRVQCPVLAIQGHDDEYATMEQLDRIARQVGGKCERMKLAGCGHAPHRERPDEVIEAIARFTTAAGG